MSKVQMLRTLVKQRLNAAAEEIFGLYERTIAEYEEELCRSKEENDRQRKLLETVFKPEAHKQSAAVHQMLMCKEETSPQQQEWSTSLDQEEPDPPHIKQEEDGLPTHHEEKTLQRPLEVHSTNVPVIVVHINSKNYENQPQSSHDHQNQVDDERWQLPACSSSNELIKGREAEEDLRESEPDCNLDPDGHLQPDTENKISISSKTETDNSDGNWKEAMGQNLCFTSLKNLEIPLSDVMYNAEEKHFSCLDCGKTFDRKDSLTRHMRSHTGEKPYSCLVCGERYTQWSHLNYHVRVHTGEKPFRCSVCEKAFQVVSAYRRT
ncbi:zinc finger protein 180-like [Thalassophryne amazonica]|uniref:zinc finger protein 180-like n=1 Tax=Thalassophryne amazonica TaxID=390379 RepID=UPI001471851D|nr:zinc finger protein 180-like [Thalassophryne amazonica]